MRVKRRREKTRPKDKKKSQRAKKAWKLFGSQMRKAARDWHKSTQGRKHHRDLARFNRNRRGESLSTKADKVLSEYYSNNNRDLKRVAQKLIDDLDLSNNIQSINVRSLRGVPSASVVMKSPVNKSQIYDKGEKDSDIEHALTRFKTAKFRNSGAWIAIPDMDNERTVSSFSVLDAGGE